ncbi:hypothetical protein COS31_03715 [Candidatus Roizmanbacteria bacterium CG02_land_8_20_14_3_00_36_15]|uniref:Excinuclease ABC subunit C n=1 Tax=Candidatus Roizmanbacteria bacterium CG10_big_fil_rev_8_21_14_0_10_36_26 TaxID=1974851 RepID=A0A2M8KMF4_9BACT|nr:MAG: hypothetical protein COS51_00150 [Candidatus Roizmanbacteria bacterium CG03_land_8_20_14_0_80_36_21]PIV37668.1 MAG: hypothetical protein COS31_03715 [Candidatus Roizmanbacteria bacterium CG02_land_8_20_14_3_00_36_15]PIY69796.1 MAG: hypothetical protein COY89_04530 [Candidatus Roizmanbacteria bacterium CG_4_10_14_0_8_um_filter_36_36]PJA53498.1 MAG: hypothetical protein CO166_01785 [Candidatus Roizmanbacteria bacterium CG_4_9_14_3_um_filter_36_11]PJE61106.1 MAG: hypothetical protein COU86
MLKKESISKVPSSPGVYIFLKKELPVYIGKATNLKVRLLSHLQSARFNRKEKLIIEEADKIRYYLTGSDLRSLLLEAKLIRLYKPKYNLRGRDDKSHLYLKITFGDKYPKIFPIRGNEISVDQEVFGPYPSQKITLELIRFLRKIFPFCTQKNISKAPCFYSKIGLCNPCPNAIEKITDSQEKSRLQRIYRKNVNNIIKLLEGNIENVIQELYKEINILISQQKYEKALNLRNRLFLLERLVNRRFSSDGNELIFTDSQKPMASLKHLLINYFPQIKRLSRIEAYDISNFAGKQVTGSMIVFTNGFAEKSNYRRFRIRSNNKKTDLDSLKEVLCRRFKNKWPSPQLIIIDGGHPQVETGKKVLTDLNKNIPLIGLAKNPDRVVIGSKTLVTLRPELNNQGFNLLRYIRDESHRFAKKYHLFLRHNEYSVY